MSDTTMSYDPSVILPGSTLNGLIEQYGVPPNLTNANIKDYQNAERAIRTESLKIAPTLSIAAGAGYAAYYSPPSLIKVGLFVAAAGATKEAIDFSSKLEEATSNLKFALSDMYNNNVPPLRPDLGNRIVYGDTLTDAYNKSHFEHVMSDINNIDLGSAGEAVPRPIEGMAERIRHYSESGDLETLRQLKMPVDDTIHTMLQEPYKAVTNQVVNAVGAGGQVPILINQYENNGVTQAFRNSRFDIDSAFQFSRSLQNTYEQQQQNIQAGEADWAAKYKDMLNEITVSDPIVGRATVINRCNNEGKLDAFRGSNIDVEGDLQALMQERYKNVMDDIANGVRTNEVEKRIKFYQNNGEMKAFEAIHFTVDNDLTHIRNQAKINDEAQNVNQTQGQLYFNTNLDGSAFKLTTQANQNPGQEQTIAVAPVGKNDMPPEFQSALAVRDLQRNPHSRDLFHAYAKDTLEKSGQGWTADSNKMIAEAMLKDGVRPQRVEESLKHSPEHVDNAYYFVKDIRNSPEIQLAQQSRGMKIG